MIPAIRYGRCMRKEDGNEVEGEGQQVTGGSRQRGKK